MRDPLSSLINPADRAFVEGIGDAAQRDVVMASLLRHRVAERLTAGDPLPDVALTRLDPRGSVRTCDLVGQRPVVLVFGSYT